MIRNMRYIPEDSSNGNDNERCTVSYAARPLLLPTHPILLPSLQSNNSCRRLVPLSHLRPWIREFQQPWVRGELERMGESVGEVISPGNLSRASRNGWQLQKASCARAVFKINHVGVEEAALLNAADSTRCRGTPAKGSDVPGHLV
jgi:hypothetical protein